MRKTFLDAHREKYKKKIVFQDGIEDTHKHTFISNLNIN